jgi:hypothetical protein
MAACYLGEKNHASTYRGGYDDLQGRHEAPLSSFFEMYQMPLDNNVVTFASHFSKTGYAERDDAD